MGLPRKPLNPEVPKKCFFTHATTAPVSVSLSDSDEPAAGLPTDLVRVRRGGDAARRMVVRALWRVLRLSRDISNRSGVLYQPGVSSGDAAVGSIGAGSNVASIADPFGRPVAPETGTRS